MKWPWSFHILRLVRFWSRALSKVRAEVFLNAFSAEMFSAQYLEPASLHPTAQEDSDLRQETNQNAQL